MNGPQGCRYTPEQPLRWGYVNASRQRLLRGFASLLQAWCSLLLCGLHAGSLRDVLGLSLAYLVA